MPNKVKHEIFAKYIFKHSFEKNQKNQKILKNPKKSCDHICARIAVPNAAKLKILAKYCFEHQSFEPDLIF